MGFAVSTIAIRGKNAAVIHSEFGVAPTGDWQEEPEASVAGVLLPGGWYLIFINDRMPPTDAELQKLAANAEVVHCDVEEHVMCSAASGWRNGRMEWCLLHNAQQGSNHLEITGELPPEFPAIAEQLQLLQREKNDADYIFDIPVELVRTLTGFRYDGNPNGHSVSQFAVLRRQQKKWWWQFWK